MIIKDLMQKLKMIEKKYIIDQMFASRRLENARAFREDEEKNETRQKTFIQHHIIDDDDASHLRRINARRTHE
jgi:hypothetical protein